MSRDAAQMIAGDHEVMMAALEALAEATAGPLADEGLPAVDRLMDALVGAVELHLDAEEQVITPRLPQLLPPSRADVDIDLTIAENLADHEELRSCLSILRTTVPGHADWSTCLDDVRRALISHIETDQAELIPAVWSRGVAEIDLLGAELDEARAGRGGPGWPLD